MKVTTKVVIIRSARVWRYRPSPASAACGPCIARAQMASAKKWQFAN
jgi:hypothetical protein